MGGSPARRDSDGLSNRSEEVALLERGAAAAPGGLQPHADGLRADLHSELARQGHPDVRPMHGFVLQAIGPEGTTAAELGRRLGVSKQAAGKTVDALERLGYVERGADPHDARRKVVRLTARGVDCLERSARIFDDLRVRWAETLGERRLRALEADLRRLTPDDVLRLDAPGWFGG